jgi:hypothetical protein
MTDSILWCRLDAPGHDACRLVARDGGWRLEGMAAFRHEGAPASLAYEAECDTAWRTTRSTVRGWVGDERFDLDITRAVDGPWILRGRGVSGLDACVDVDLGFTPATNLFQLRRIALEVGQGADVPVAWIDVLGTTLEVVHQRYERLSADTYRYESPRFEYRETLRVTTAGFVALYPRLWEVEEVNP